MTGYALRIARDGTAKFGQPLGRSATVGVAANAAGVVATAHAHFNHAIVFRDAMLKPTAEQADFAVGDAIGWDAPGAIEVGASGDFYAVDQHRDRILRLAPDGRIVTAFAIARDPGAIQFIRVCEAKQRFFVIAGSGAIRCIGFDGATRWSVNASLAGEWYLASRAFDCDDDGNLYVLENGSDALKRFDADGKPAGAVTLHIGDHRPPAGQCWYFALRIAGGDCVVRSNHPSELFQVYDLRTGAFKRSVSADVEVLRATYPSPVWTAGAATPFAIDFATAGRRIAPRWRLWARPLDSADWREFEVAGDAGKRQATAPADAAGLYRIKLTPEVEPRERGGDAQVASEYQLQAVIEVRPTGARGSLSVLTQDCRAHFAPGEAIPFSVIARAAAAHPVATAVKLVQGTHVVAEVAATIPADGAPLAFTLPATLTSGLLPGTYRLTAETAGFTAAAQTVVIGQRLREPPFFTVQYGDYALLHPRRATFWTAPDLVDAHARRLGLAGVTLLVERIGSRIHGDPFAWDQLSRTTMTALADRLQADPIAVAPAKAAPAAPFLQSLAAYGASGVQHMGILMGNDAGLPLASGFDNRTPDQLTQAIAAATRAVLTFPAFRGWSWSSNWWVFGARGAAAAASAAEKAACEAALAAAKETGAWDPVIDTVAGRRLALAVDAQALFNRALAEAAPDKRYVSAVAAPYRNVEAYPPTTFANVDEVDLQIQWEQIAVPYNAPHNVDFYKRPGKRAWAHPEAWNDDGTGGQLLTELAMLAMRGADGVGVSGELVPWAGVAGGRLHDDPRIGHFGTASVHRAANALFRAYGPMLAKLGNDDRVAIAASGRMYRLDEWHHVMGLHFGRQFEAYIACLHAHHPASIVFAEDVEPDTFARFKAVLLVDERVELEPALRGALEAAQKAGTTVFHDRTCRASVVRGFTPLDIAFDQVEKDPSEAGDDHAYWRYSGYATAHATALAKALDPLTPPAASVDDPEILISQRAAESARYLWVVNRTMPRIPPGQIWRMTLGLTSRIPLIAPIALPAASARAGAIYDVFAMRRVTAADGVLQADLRSLPARLYAFVPAAIAQVAVSAPPTVAAGSEFTWSAGAVGADGKPIAAAVPLRVRLKDADGAVIDERFVAAGSVAATGTCTAPFAGTGGGLTLQVTELLSGLSADAPIAITAAAVPAIVVGASPAATSRPAAAGDGRRVLGGEAGDASAADLAFGPHVRDMVVSEDGAQVVMTTMNWDHNLYALDAATGAVSWRQRAGHYFTFSPRALRSGVAVEGFDLESGEGYHLYLTGVDGRLERRFALHGIPKRLPHRFVPGIVCEDKHGLDNRIDGFAVPHDGAWVATAGDLGLAVWSRDGKPRWRQDWPATGRHAAAIAAIDARTLLVIESMNASFHDAATGKKRAEVRLAIAGTVRRIVVSADGSTVAVLSTTDSGRVHILRGDAVARVFATAGEDAALSPDGTLLAVVDGNQLKLCSIDQGLQWSFAGDDALRFPRFAPDGARIVVTSDIGSAYVLDREGALRWENDLGARGVPGWLPDGDLVLASWMGAVVRLGADYQPKWRSRLAPEATDMRDRLLKDDGAPTTRIATRGNAADKPLPITPNLLAENPVICNLVQSGSWGGGATFANDVKLLWDGSGEAPPQPWIGWNFIGFFAETSPVNYLQIDAFRKQLRVTGITFVEDPAHPESWLRDATFDWWDAAAERWVTAMPILADAPIHTHVLATPIEAARFRVMLPWGAVGNLRFGEIVLHGTGLGCSHPDAAAKRPVAVLFDEQDDLKRTLRMDNGASFKLDAAYSGGRCLAIAGGKRADAAWLPPFGHRMANWDFEIVESPQPGQYRWLQFACKAASPKTTAVALMLAGDQSANLQVHVGERIALADSAGPEKQAAASPTAEWTVVRVDLWELNGRKPARIQTMTLAAAGDGAFVDQILLGRSENDLRATPVATTGEAQPAKR